MSSGCRNSGDGRMWAVEMPGFVPNLQAPEPYMEPIGKVVVLEDTDRDGVMDKRTVFADGLVLARSLKVLDRGILVGIPASGPVADVTQRALEALQPFARS